MLFHAGIDLKKEMAKRLEAMEEQFKKEKEESKLQFEKERKVGNYFVSALSTDHLIPARPGLLIFHHCTRWNRVRGATLPPHV